MSKNTDTFAKQGSSKKLKAFFALSAIACGGGLYYQYRNSYEAEPERLIIGEDGTEWHLVEGGDLQQLFLGQQTLPEELTNLDSS